MSSGFHELLQAIVLTGNDATITAEVTGVPLTWLIGFFFVSATLVAVVALFVGLVLSKGEREAETAVHGWAGSTLTDLAPRFDAAREQPWSEERLRAYLAGLVELQRSVPPLVRSAQPRQRSVAAFLVAGLAAIALAVFAVVLALQLAPDTQGAQTDAPATEETTEEDAPATEETTDEDAPATEETTDPNDA